MIDQLEAWRIANRLKKNELAERFGVKPTTYSQWLFRGAIPARYMDEARAMISEDEDPATIEFQALLTELPAKEVTRLLRKYVNGMSRAGLISTINYLLTKLDETEDRAGAE